MAFTTASVPELTGRTFVISGASSGIGCAAAQVLAARHARVQLGTNQLAHFAFTGLLLPQLLATEAPRVVNVSSIFHEMGTLALDDIPKPRACDSQRAYGMSKLANLLFTYELDRRAKAAKTKLIGVACHPACSSFDRPFGHSSWRSMHR